MRASLSKTWFRRQILITLFCFGVGLWFFYDGRFGFPQKNERFLAHKEFENQNRSDWEQYAKSRGWPKRPPERLYKKVDIVVQYAFGVALTIGGIAALGLLIVSKNRTVSSDAEAYYAENGQRVAFDAIRSIDKSKWDSKGIAVLIYQDGRREAKAVIDDYKFEGAEQILLQAEAALQTRTKA